MKKYTVFLLIVSASLINSYAGAKEIAYQGQVDGMVCAFCSYNVTKKIASLPGVIDASVNVNLTSGKFWLLSTVNVESSEISETFSDSGFKLISFSETKPSKVETVSFQQEPVLKLNFNTSDLALIEAVLGEVGNIAMMKSSKILMSAPSTSEIALLKPILAGKQKQIKIVFVANDNNLIEIQLFQKSE